MKPFLSIILIFSFVVNTGQLSKDTEIWSPIPKKVNSISDSSPPSDAIILFDDYNLINQEGVKKAVKDLKIDLDRGIQTQSGQLIIFT